MFESNEARRAFGEQCARRPARGRQAPTFRGRSRVAPHRRAVGPLRVVRTHRRAVGPLREIPAYRRAGMRRDHARITNRMRLRRARAPWCDSNRGGPASASPPPASRRPRGRSPRCGDEGFERVLAALHATHPELPLAGHRRALHLRVHRVDERLAARSRDDPLAVAHEVLAREQGLEDRRARRRRAEPGLLHRLAELLLVERLARGLHRRQQRGFGEGLRRLRLLRARPRPRRRTRRPSRALRESSARRRPSTTSWTCDREPSSRAIRSRCRA